MGWVMMFEIWRRRLRADVVDLKKGAKAIQRRLLLQREGDVDEITRRLQSLSRSGSGERGKMCSPIPITPALPTATLPPVRRSSSSTAAWTSRQRRPPSPTRPHGGGSRRAACRPRPSPSRLRGGRRSDQSRSATSHRVTRADRTTRRLTELSKSLAAVTRGQRFALTHHVAVSSSRLVT